MNQDLAKLLLVGAGPMAIDFAKVLNEFKIKYLVIGRGEKSAENFEKEIGKKVITGGLKKFSSSLKENSRFPKKAIVAVTEDELGKVTLELLSHGVKEILVEKPGGFDFNEIIKVKETAKKNSAKVYVGYNRRFYASVEKAKEIIKKDGGVLSFTFDFTELSDRIAPLKKAPGVKQQWFLHNSTHVIDLAFYLGEKPIKLASFIEDKLPWHPNGAIFSGAGVSRNDSLFSYSANWKAPGRWAVEIFTKNYHLVFKPLEKLQIQERGSFEIKEVEIENKVDINFKPGVYKEVTAFLGEKKNLCTISEQVENLKNYQKILNGR